MALSNGFAWFEFDPIVTQVKSEFPDVTSTTIQLLSSWQPVVFIILFVPMTILITKTNGLRKSLRIGSSCAMAGAALKVCGCLFFKQSIVGLIFLNLGQIFVAVGAPGVIGGVTSLSANFFPPHERARATAAAVLFNDMGGAVGYLVSPALANTSFGLTAVVLFDLSFSGLICLFMWFVFPDTPKRRSATEAAPEDTIALEHHHFEEGSEGVQGSPTSTGGILTNLANSDFTSHITFKAQVMQLITRFTPIMVMVIFNWCSGGFVAWTSMFDLMLENHYSSTIVGTISFTASICYVIGGLVAGYLIDKFFSRHMSAFISIALAIACVATTAFTAVVPNEEGFVAIEVDSSIPIFVFAGLAGIGFGAATPVFFELLADYSYPVDEAVSGGLLSLMEATGALLIYQIVARIFEGNQLNYAFAGGCALCLVGSTFLDEQHNRPAEESEEEEEDELNIQITSKGGRTLGRRTAKDGDGGAEELAEVELRKSQRKIAEETGPINSSTASHSDTHTTVVTTSAPHSSDSEAKKRQLLLLKKKKLLAAKRAKEAKEKKQLQEREVQETNENDEKVGLTRQTAMEDD